MAQTQEVRGVQTKIIEDGEKTSVVYRGTAVVVFDDKTVTLNSNGWRTATTKTRMMQAANQFDLGFYVSQKNFEWFVDLPNGRRVEYTDNMVFSRTQ